MGLSHSKKFNPADLPDLHGKVFVITGGACVPLSPPGTALYRRADVYSD